MLATVTGWAAAVENASSASPQLALLAGAIGRRHLSVARRTGYHRDSWNAPSRSTAGVNDRSETSDPRD